MIDREAAHKLSNMLQTLMGQMELERTSEAKQTVRLIADFVNIHTEQRAGDESTS